MHYKYTEDKILDIWKKLVANKSRPSNYDQALKIEEAYTSLEDGEKLGGILTKYRDNIEDKEVSKVEKINNSKTPCAINRLRTIYLEVDRHDGKKDILTLDGKDASPDLSQLKLRMNNFEGRGKSIDDYLDQHYWDWASLEPNSWLVLDFHPFDHKKDRAWTYPTHIKTKNVRGFEYVSGTLQYFAYHETIKVKGLDDNNNPTAFKEKLEWVLTPTNRYSLFKKPKGYELKEGEEIIRLRREVVYTAHIDEKTKVPIPASGKQEEFIDYVFNGSYDMKSAEVPAYQIGRKPDRRYKGLKQSLLKPAKERLFDLAQTKARLDVVMSLHGIVQKFVYVEACNAKDEVTGKVCHHGKWDNAPCGVCGGTGKKKLHKSDFDVVTLELPMSVDGIRAGTPVDLANLIHFAEFPQNIVDKLHELVNEYELDVALSLFNTNIFNRSAVVAPTATEVNSNWKPVNNVLYQYATGKKLLYEWCVRVTAHNADFDINKLQVKREYPTDFNLESYQELISMRTNALEAGSPSEVVHTFDEAILRKQNKNDHNLIDKIRCKEYFKPFKNLPEDDRASMALLLPEHDPKRILFMYYDDVFDHIEENIPNFWKMPKLKLREKIDELVQKHLTEYKSLKREKAPIKLPITDVEI